MSIADGERLGKVINPDFEDDGLIESWARGVKDGDTYEGQEDAAPSDGPAYGGYDDGPAAKPGGEPDPGYDDYGEPDEAQEGGFADPDSDPPPRRRQPPQQSPPPPRQPRTWTEPEIKRHFGVGDGTNRFDIGEFDQDVANGQGPMFRQRVQNVASEFAINPGLLLVNALTEGALGFYMNRHTPVRNYHVGLDYWESVYTRVVAVVPGAEGLQGTPYRNESGDFVFTNERGEDTGKVMEFANGLDALRAMAAYLKYLQIQLQEHVGLAHWMNMDKGTQFLLIRYAFNAGLARAKMLATRAAEGDNIILQSGPAGTDHPQRSGSIRAGQAIDWSARTGQPLPYDGP